MFKIIGSLFVVVVLVALCIANLLISDSVPNCLVGGGCLVVATIWAYISMMCILKYRTEKRRLADNLHRSRCCTYPCPECRAIQLEAEGDEEWKNASLREKIRVVKGFLILLVVYEVFPFFFRLYDKLSAGLEKVRSVFLRRRRRAAKEKKYLLENSIVTFQQKVEMCSWASAFLPPGMEPTRRVRCLIEKSDMTRARAQYLLEHQQEFIEILRSMVLV